MGEVGCLLYIYSTMADYAPVTPEGSCLFCKIVDGQIKTPGVFWENDRFMAFLSLFPNTEGFTVVVPKQHYGSDVLAMPADVLQEFVLAAKEVSRYLRTILMMWGGLD